MAKQKGILRFEGTIGDITFVRINGKYFARQKSSLDREQVMTTENFANSRKCMSEFGRASLGAQLLREAFALTGKTVGDRDQYARLTGYLRTLLLTETVHSKGERRLSSSDLHGIKDFRWSKKGSFANLFMAPIAMAADQAAGTLTATIPALDPNRMINKHPKATHYRIIMEGAAIDFEKHRLSKGMADTGWLLLDELQPEQQLEIHLTDTAGRFLFSGLKIEFADECNGRIEPFFDQRKEGFSCNYMGQVPAATTPTRSAAEILSAGYAAVQEALEIIDWEAARTAQKALTTHVRKQVPKKAFAERLRGKDKHKIQRKHAGRMPHG